MDDWTTQDLFICEKCKKQFSGYNEKIVIVYHGHMTKNWKDARIVQICKKCFEVIGHKKEGDEFTDYVFENNIGNPAEVRINEEGKECWRHKIKKRRNENNGTN